MNRAVGYLKHDKLGLIKIVAIDEKITQLSFSAEELNEAETPTELIEECKKQLREYFGGERKKFNLPLGIEGTGFQKRVWSELLNIPYGTTVSYQKIAENIDKPKACRAVGGANNKNKIGIIIPCHRVIGKKGTLTGYAGGLDKKEYLLNLEKGLL